MTKKNYSRELYTNKEDWLKARGIGGSSAGAILGVSKWETANDVYSSIVFNRNKSFDNERMKEGRDAEDLIRKLFIIEHPNLKVVEPPVNNQYRLFRRVDEPMLTLTPDGLIDDDGGLEIKDVELRKKEDIVNWLSGNIPPYYYTQLIQYFIVKTDLKYMILLARLKIYQKGELDHIETREYKLTRKGAKKEIEKQEKILIDFIRNNIEQKIRPSLKIKMKGN